MILHFLRRDFLSHKMNWIIIAIITLIALPMAWTSESAIFVLGYAYFFFALAPIQYLTGAQWRSQHVMSRSYLKSLPVSRDKMYRLLYIRAGVFYMPFFVLLLALPFASPGFVEFLKMSRNWFPIYALMLFAGMVWVNGSFIEMQMSFERITSYLGKGARLLAWLKLFGLYAIEGIVIVSCFVATSFANYWILPALAVISGVATIRYVLTRRMWFGV